MNEAKQLASEINKTLDYYRVPHPIKGEMTKDGIEMAHTYIETQELQNMLDALAQIRQLAVQELLS